MTTLTKLVSKFNPRKLRYGRDFSIEQLNMGANHNELLEIVEEEIIIDEPKVEDPSRVVEEPKMYVVRGFTERVQEFMKRKGWTHG